MKRKVLSILALLLMAATGAWADDTYTIKFEANGNSKTVENVTLPHTFSCDYSGENGELDQIIKQLYGLSGGCCGLYSPGASGNSNVTAGVNGDNQFITISAPFEGNATVTGSYFDAAGGYRDFDYSLTISCPGYAPPTVDVTGVTLSQTSASMTVGGETLTLTATVAPDDATDKTVTWASSDAAVATVADGVVTAVGAGTATITVTATNGTDDTSDDKTATCTVTVTAAATQYDLTVGESLHGTVAFTVDGAAATQAKKDDMVTVTVTPAEGYSTKDVTVRAYTTWEAAPARGMNRAPGLLDEIAVTKNETDGTWSFTMPEANVWVVVTYTKDLQDAWIEAIADQTYTGEALTPAVVVKDGETTLTLNTDYTVAYADNTAAGTATVTVTSVEGSDYSGTASKTFTIKKADITMTTAPAAVADLVYSGEPQTLITAGVASFGTVLYSLDGTNFGDALPQATDAGTYTVTYKVEGDDNHNAFAAQTLNVTIATNKTALNTAITDAETYYNSIKDSNPDAAEVLKDAIDAAKAVKDNADATQTEIETATTTLNTAVAAAQADVALKRVTIVIPAKSYVARIDAEKRQIEVAVAGVSLYSVKSVTDSEVELTAALSVVAAEMPYLIYNDNDEEKTISIVVSAEEADAVEYDSEHFKGTLTDKTFTAEDMAAADHYVLQNGQDFVWVKDAGTLAAGKCWIELVPTSEAHARRLVIVHEGDLTPTGINAINAAANMDGNIYDLSGRRVMQPTKGLYIIGGKKVVVK